MSQFIIRLQDQKIALRAQAEPSVAQETLELVQRFLDDAEDRTPRSALPHHVVLMALLDLAEEYVCARRRTEAYRLDLEQRAGRILELLDVPGASEVGSIEASATGLATQAPGALPAVSIRQGS